jgi:hypothetical protein
LRRVENEVMRMLEFRIGGEKLVFDAIVETISKIAQFLPTHIFRESSCSLKSKAIQIALNYLRYETVDVVAHSSSEELVAACTYLGAKYEENRLGYKLMTNEAFSLICFTNNRPN